MSESANPPHFTLALFGRAHDLQVLSFSGVESISTPYCFDIELVSRDVGLDPESFLNTLGFLAFDQHGSGVHGRIERCRKATPGQRQTGYSMRLVPRLANLKHRTNHRIFQHLTVEEIIGTLLKEHGILSNAFTFDLRATYPPREYCVQYGETDLHFLQRLCWEEGIHYRFKHSVDDHLLMFGDHQSGIPKVPRVTPFAVDAGMVPDGPVIRAFSSSFQTRPSRTTLHDYFFELSGRTLKDDGGQDFPRPGPNLEAYSYPGGFSDAERSKLLSKRVLERHRIDYHQIDGESDQPALVSGHYMEMVEHPVGVWNQLWLLTEIIHRGEQPQVLEESPAPQQTPEGLQQGYRNTFTATPWDAFYRSQTPYEKPSVKGPQTARVTGPVGEEIYCDAYGRVKVQFHWDREDKNNEYSSCWLRVGSSLAGNGFGAVSIPRVGMEVLVHFENGDLDHPLIGHCLSNNLHPVPYELPAHKTRSVFRSRSTPDSRGYNELLLEDRTGRELIRLRAQRDLEQWVQNDSRLEVGNERKETIKGNSIVTLEAEDQRTVVGDRKTHLKASDYLQVDDSSHTRARNTLVIEAGQEVHIKAGARLIVDGGTSLTLGAGGHHIVIGPEGILSSTPIQQGGVPGRGTLADLQMPGLLAQALPPEIAPTQIALMVKSKAIGADFCPLCEACKQGICLPKGATA